MTRAPRLLALPAAAGLVGLAALPAAAATTPVEVLRAVYASPAVIGAVPSGSGTYDVKEGGFSAFAPVAGSSTDLWTLTDRGANADPASGSGKVFVVPSFAPEIVRLHVEGTTLTVAQRIRLHLPGEATDPARADSHVGVRPGGSAGEVTGLPLRTDEEPPSAGDGSALPADPYGVDSEGLAVAPDGSFWVSEEYGPSVLHVAADGTLLRRLVPAGSTVADAGAPVVPVSKVLPAEWSSREVNKGAEGVALTPQGQLVVALQGPLYTPGCTATDGTLGTPSDRRTLRLATVDVTSPDAPVAGRELLYRTDAHTSGKYFISDLSWDATGDRLVVDERDSKLTHKDAYVVSRAALAAATDVTGRADALATSGNQCLDTRTDAELASLGVVPAAKALLADLRAAVTAGGTAAPYDVEKAEGVGLLPNGLLAVLDDNDFGFTGTQSAGYADSGVTSQLREYQVAAPGTDVPEAPAAALLALAGLGVVGTVVALRRRAA